MKLHGDDAAEAGPRALAPRERVARVRGEAGVAHASRARVRLLEDFCDNSFIPPAGLVLAELNKPEAERDAEKVRRCQGEVGRVLGRLESQLEAKQFLVGDFSLADVAFVPRVLLLSQLGVELDARLQHVAAWIGRLRERPSVRSLGF